MSSSSSTDEVAGYTISRTLGSGPHGTVHAATQDGLGRPVALKVGSWEPADWPEHPGVARLFAAGRLADGRVYTAAQLAPGGSLRHPARPLTRQRGLALCDEVEATLAELDVAHGALHAGNVLIDENGRALLRDFAPGARAADDAAALARLRASCAQLPARDRRPWLIAAVGAVTAGAVGLLVFGSGDDDRPGLESVDCGGLACTLVSDLRVRGDSVITGWTVRGGRGGLQLQLVRPLGDGYFVQVQASAQAEGAAGHPTRLLAREGDRLAVALTPSAAVGTTGPGRTLRFTGRLGQSPPRSPIVGPARRLALAITTRPGPAPEEPEPAGELAGTPVATAPVKYAPGRTLRIVRAGPQVLLELRRGGDTLARLVVRDADPRGTLAYLSGDTAPEVGWRNPDGTTVAHAWTRSRTSPREVY